MPTQTKPRALRRSQSAPAEVLNAILEELRLMRGQLALLFPSDDLTDFAHADRITRSYEKAVKEYPPVSP
ncbi:hypothetical protein HY478_01270 [Candidatus Uhrbacteria bacterium]|nr:hypothetical protein [Candidatus Uhrbacteria bacterium]